MVDIGLRSPLRGVGMRLGVVRPPVGTGKLLRGVRLLVGSPYILGEEEEIDLIPFSPLGPLGGNDAAGLILLELGVLIRDLADERS